VKIIDIKDKTNYGNYIDIILDVEFDPDRGYRYELVKPQVVIRYSPEKGGIVQSAELIDNGQDVHGFEFKYDEIKEIEEFLRNRLA